MVRPTPATPRTPRPTTPSRPTQPPPVVVITGVSGSGKSTVGAALAGRLGWDWADGDAFHPGSNVAKMAAHEPLTDADRLPWLDEIGGWIDKEAEAGRPAVIACSALKRSYRDRLRTGRPQVRMVYLVVDLKTLHQRLTDRRGHMFHADMLGSQLSTLEPPAPEEDVLMVKSAGSPKQTVDHIITWEGLAAFLPSKAGRRQD
ncbi:gluconokinase [Catenulispora sp. NF23]|uniref:Gluconokinase n=1 Tax=Catenulispora pinistramenti TaxID=2705254 RepID=A0ABS5KV14_9ACTN|nr:gluconokinase [Catenulispora pinistramenti]MBS2536646.1 gluconokinase [Catenulispora pinistramenti]MBS2549888.1 gluconokinase [Catenulispora pinistramenti]